MPIRLSLTKLNTMLKANVHQAKTHLSHLLEQVESGEEVIICRGKKPIAKIISFQPHPKERILGRYKGIFEVGPAFFEPMTDEELAEWGY